MQAAVTFFLVAVLAATVVSIAAMALRQHRRSGRLEQEACERNLHFSAPDPFDIPRRYARFEAIRTGHSPRADNVAHGRVGGWPVRAFDFRYELGHGPRRQTRHCSVLVLETDRPLPECLLWNDGDAEHAPLTLRLPDGRVPPWTHRGSAVFAERLARLLSPLADSAVSAQVLRGTLLLSRPERRGRGGYLELLAAAEGLAGDLQGASAAISEHRHP